MWIKLSFIFSSQQGKVQSIGMQINHNRKLDSYNMFIYTSDSVFTLSSDINIWENSKSEFGGLYK